MIPVLTRVPVVSQGLIPSRFRATPMGAQDYTPQATIPPGTLPPGACRDGSRGLGCPDSSLPIGFQHLGDVEIKTTATAHNGLNPNGYYGFGTDVYFSKIIEGVSYPAGLYLVKWKAGLWSYGPGVIFTRTGVTERSFIGWEPMSAGTFPSDNISKNTAQVIKVIYRSGAALVDGVFTSVPVPSGDPGFENYDGYGTAVYLMLHEKIVAPGQRQTAIFQGTANSYTPIPQPGGPAANEYPLNVSARGFIRFASIYQLIFHDGGPIKISFYDYNLPDNRDGDPPPTFSLYRLSARVFFRPEVYAYQYQSRAVGSGTIEAVFVFFTDIPFPGDMIFQFEMLTSGGLSPVSAPVLTSFVSSAGQFGSPLGAYVAFASYTYSPGANTAGTARFSIRNRRHDGSLAWELGTADLDLRPVIVKSDSPLAPSGIWRDAGEGFQSRCVSIGGGRKQWWVRLFLQNGGIGPTWDLTGAIVARPEMSNVAAPFKIGEDTTKVGLVRGQRLAQGLAPVQNFGPGLNAFETANAVNDVLMEVRLWDGTLDHGSLTFPLRHIKTALLADFTAIWGTISGLHYIDATASVLSGDGPFTYQWSASPTWNYTQSGSNLVRLIAYYSARQSVLLTLTVTDVWGEQTSISRIVG